MRRISPLFCLVAIVLAAVAPTPSHACNGPCSRGDVWDAQRFGDELSVVTNFGVVRQDGDDWQLYCEELFGGLLVKAAFEPSAQLISTSVGFFRGSDDRCEWTEATNDASNDWFLDFVVLDQEHDETDGSLPTVYALLIDRETQEAKVERAIGEGDFETLATFPSASGLRYLATDGERAYAMGYTYAPRVWNVKVIDFADPMGSPLELAIDQEAEADVQLRPLAAGEETPESVWLRGVTSLPPERLYHLDVPSESIDEVFALNGEERVAALTFDDERLLLAGRGEGTSTIYTADQDTLDFDVHVELQATLTCLRAESDVWIACNSDFTGSSEYLVASSDDDGESWQPMLTTRALGAMVSCGDDTCVATTDWLAGLFGPGAAQQDGGAPTPGTSDTDDDSENDAGANLAPPRIEGTDGDDAGGCGCHVPGTPMQGGRWLGLGLLTALALWWRSSGFRAR